MAAEALLPPPVVEAVARALGAPVRSVRPTSGGSSHRSAAAVVAGQAVVIKAASAAPQRADLRHEAAVLTALVSAALPVPQLLALVEADGWTAEVLAALPGVNGLALYAPERAAELPGAFTQLGRVLAQLHALPVPEAFGPSEAVGTSPPRSQETKDTKAEREGGLAERLQIAASGPPLVTDPALDAALRRAGALAAAADWRGAALLHGDAGLHNVLWDGQLRALLDWEWAAIGSPLLDLAWTRWTLRWRRVPQLWPQLLAGYGLAADALDPAELDTCALALIGVILLRVRDNPAAYAEWVRRAGWTAEVMTG